MKKGCLAGIIIVVVLALLALGGVIYVKNHYNRFVQGEESVKQAWAQVENQYQDRKSVV
jgi:hypothetical protein